MAVTAPPAWSRLGTASGWPVLVILAGQAALTLRLMWRDGAAPAEGAYLNSWPADPGHWLPGSAGLTAGRLLSLALMLVATTLLHGTTRRLYDRRSAFFAGAIFAGLAGTAFLGAFASGDAMSVTLLATAAWLGARAAGRRGAAQAGLAAGAGAMLALVIAAGPGGGGLAGLAGLSLTTLAVWRAGGARAAGQAAAAAGAALAGALGTLALAAGALAAGPARGTPALDVLRAWLTAAPAGAGGLAGAAEAAAGSGGTAGSGAGAGGASWPAALVTGDGRWLAVLAVLALAGALVTIAARQGWPVSLLSVVLAAAPLAIPAETMRVQLGSWLAVPCCCGAWLGCVIAGYGVASLARGVPRAKSAAAFGVGIGAVVLAAVPGAGWAGQQVSWPQAGPVVSRVQALLASHDGPVLADGTGDQLRLYLGGSLARRVVMQAGAGGGVRQCDPAACRVAIAQHRFGIIVLSLWHAGPASYQLQRAIVLAGYRRVAPVPAAAGGGRPGAPAGPGAAAGSGAAAAAGAGGTGAGPWNVWVRAGRP